MTALVVMDDAVTLHTSELIVLAVGQRFSTMPPVEPQPTSVRGSPENDQCGAIAVVSPVIVVVLGVLSVPVFP